MPTFGISRPTICPVSSLLNANEGVHGEPAYIYSSARGIQVLSSCGIHQFKRTAVCKNPSMGSKHRYSNPKWRGYNVKINMGRGDTHGDGAIQEWSLSFQREAPGYSHRFVTQPVIILLLVSPQSARRPLHRSTGHQQNSSSARRYD